MPNSKKIRIQKLLPFTFFALILVVIPVFCSKPFCKPYHYIIQFGLLSTCLLFFLGLIFFSSSKPTNSVSKNKIQLLFEIALMSYIFLTTVSFFWAVNQAEAIFAIQKVWLTGMVYFVAKYLFIRYSDICEKIIFKLSCIIISFIILHAMYSFFDLWIRLEDSIYKNFIFLNDILYALDCILGHKAVLSTFLLLLLPFNLIGFVSSEKKDKSWQRWHFSALIAQLGLILLLQSRGVILSLFIFSFLVACYFFRKKSSFLSLKNYYKKIFFGTATLLLVLVFLIFLKGDSFEILGRLNPFNWLGSTTVNERFQIWSKTFQIIQQEPKHFFWGVGAGNWEVYFPSVGLGDMRRVSYYEKVIKHSHSVLLNVWSEAGIFALISYSLLFLLPIIAAFEKVFCKKNKQNDYNLNDFKVITIAVLILAFATENIVNAANLRWSIFLIFIILLSYLFNFLLIDFKNKNVKSDFDFKSKKVLTNKCLNIKTFKSKKVITFLVLIIFLITCLPTVYYRFLGQKEMGIVRSLARKKQWSLLKVQAHQAYSPFYTLNNRTYPIKSYLALAYHKMDEIDLAIFNYEQGLEAHPYHYPTLMGLGDVYLEQKNYTKARQYYLQIVDIYPQNEKLNFQLAATEIGLQKYDKAYQWLKNTTTNMTRKKALVKQIKKAKKARKK